MKQNGAFGERMRLMRHARRLTQQELGDLVGLDMGYISRFETGRMVPTHDEVSRIKAALNWPDNAAEAFAILGQPTESPA